LENLDDDDVDINRARQIVRQNTKPSATKKEGDALPPLLFSFAVEWASRKIQES